MIGNYAICSESEGEDLFCSKRYKFDVQNRDYHKFYFEIPIGGLFEQGCEEPDELDEIDEQDKPDEQDEQDKPDEPDEQNEQNEDL